MAWPSSPGFTTGDVDQPTDSPAAARSHLKILMDNVIAMIGGRGQAAGVASLDATSKIPIAQIPPVPFASGVFVDKVPGSRTWTVPAGVTKVWVEVWGGGGGGGYVTPGTGGDHGGGGGAGGGAWKFFTVVPGTIFSYTVGAGGTGKSSGSDGDGNAGTASSATSPASATPASYTVSGGLGDKGQGPPDRFGGSGGMGTNGDINLRGGSGTSGSTRGGSGGGNGRAGGSAGAPQSDGWGGGGFGSGGGTSAFDGLHGTVAFWY